MYTLVTQNKVVQFFIINNFEGLETHKNIYTPRKPINQRNYQTQSQMKQEKNQSKRKNRHKTNEEKKCVNLSQTHHTWIKMEI